MRLRARGGREEQEEGVLNVMDGLTEWCHPDGRLLPDDPSLSPSGAGAEEEIARQGDVAGGDRRADQEGDERLPGELPVRQEKGRVLIELPALGYGDLMRLDPDQVQRPLFPGSDRPSIKPGPGGG